MEKELIALKLKMDSYYPLSEQTWNDFRKLCHLKKMKRNQFVELAGEISNSIYFVYSGLVRTYSLTTKNKEITKGFFSEGRFPADIVSLLTNSPNSFFIETLEPCSLIQIDFKGFRKLLKENSEISQFHINYIEKHWIIEKEDKDISFRADTSDARYRKFISEYPDLFERVSLLHLASYLGITATQLSRIRKK